VCARRGGNTFFRTFTKGIFSTNEGEADIFGTTVQRLFNARPLLHIQTAVPGHANV
jgi:hypothetical protein